MGVVEFFLLITCLALGMTLPTVIAWDADAVTVKISKDDCEDICGDVRVPFPFGFGKPKCFLDESYEMVCNKSITPHKLFLKRLKLEVLNISWNFDGYSGYDSQWLTVKGPISYSNCGHGKENQRETIDVTTLPFSLSDKNMFVAVSCGVFAEMSWNSGNVFSHVGCNSTCSTAASNYHNVSCDEINCCQTPITSMLDSFEIKFNNSTSSVVERKTSDDQCKFAFLIDRDYWLDYQNKSSNFVKIRDNDYVPLKLEWYFANHSYFDMFKTNIHEDMGSHKDTRYCYEDYYPTSVISTLLVCRCPMELLGNPYLPQGCTQDINECKEYDEPCSGWGSTCVNTHGNYHCSYKRKYLLIGFGTSFGALFLLFGIWGLNKKIKAVKEAKQRKKFFKRNGGLLLQQQLSSGEGTVERTKIFDSNELDKATLHFSIDRIIGQGGQGTVYKGMLDDGKIVAVKKSIIVDEEKLAEFINEVVILSQINHRNVVQLLGCCLETEVPILVYEFIPNGTLFQYIHEQNDDFPLTWKVRLRIATQVAGALSYLHSAASFPIYHRDIKSTNILLDEKYKAKVADFGTSRTISLEQTHLTTLVYGTLGYLDPEYFQSSQFTEKSDVYSFGVVLAELLTGQKVICATREEDARNLATYFTMSMESNCLFEIVDARVLEDGSREEILIVACLALRCLNLSGRNRPTMKEVALELEGIQKTEREVVSLDQPDQEDMKYIRRDSYESWDSASLSIESSVFGNTVTRSSLQQELPLLSFESK